jgi:hypothetical protein
MLPTRPPASRITSNGRGPRSSRSLSPIELPPPKIRGGRSLSESLQRRRTIREIRDKRLSTQLLSNLLWAACGVNRPKGPFGTVGI